MKRLNRYLYFSILILTLSACAALGLQQPQSFEDKLRYGQAGVSSVYKSIGDLKSGKLITATQGASYFQRNEMVETTLDKVEELACLKPAPVTPCVKDLTTAKTRLEFALQSLLTIQNELKKYKSP